jgi:Protein of unknown function (DUF3175)
MARTPKTRRAQETKRGRRTAAHRRVKATGTRWSAGVTTHSDALDLKPGVFTHDSAKLIADSLKRSAERSTRRKADPYRSALSMLVFYINRAGKNLPAARRKTLERAEIELRRLFKRGEA